MTRLGLWSSRHRRLVIVAWLVLLVVAIAGDRVLGGTFSDTLTIPGSSAERGLGVLRAHDRRAGGQGGQLVFVSPGKLSATRRAIEEARANLSRLPHVLSVSDPFAARSVSADGRTAYARVNFDTNPQSLGRSYLRSVDAATAVARTAGVSVDYGGALGQAARPKAKDARSEAIGIAVALLALLVAFGSVLAAGLPLLSALLGVFAGLGLLGMLAAGITFGSSSPTLATMMGLGVGIDYALFLTTRFRQRIIDGEDTEAALRTTLAGSGKAVVIAASTVVIAMLGLYGSGIAFVGKLGLAASITVAVAALAALTLVPALLTAAAGRIDAWTVRKPVAEPGSGTGNLHRYVAALARHPWRYAACGIVALAVVAIPTFSMRMGHVTAGAQPTSYTERRAYDEIANGFGAGANGPFTIVVQPGAGTPSGQLTSLTTTLGRKLRTTPGVASVTGFEPSPDGAILVARLIPKSGPGTTATAALFHRLQRQTLPETLAPAHVTGYVTGTVPAELDFQATVSGHLPIIIAVVLAAAILLLLVNFRSPVLAVKAALLNLLSIGTAYGVVVAVFQWGWGVRLIGVSGPVPIESYVPMIIFAIVFGLSMDYEVFLLSRIREHWLETGDNESSVAAGLAQTARVISCAALIMASVFLAFLLSSSIVIKMLALGLGVSVVIDATVIRLLIVPALMFLFGDANWWSPPWLEKVLPGLEAEPATGSVPRGRLQVEPERP